MEGMLDIGLFVVAVALIAKGADWFTEAAVRIAEATHVPKVLIGATIVSLATTLPEFSVSAIATLQKHTDMAIGNAVGSVICNIGLILGTCTIVRASVTERRILNQQGLVMIGAGVLVYILTLGGELSRVGGVILITALVIHMYRTAQTARARRSTVLMEIAESASEHGPSANVSIGGAIGEFLFGAVFVIVGSRLLVYTGIRLAEAWGVPELIISLTLVALGTSLPELVTALVSTIKGHQEMAVGNVIGANILNVLWVLGGCALIQPLPLNPEQAFLGFPQVQSLDMPVMCLLMLLLVGFGYAQGRLRRREGAVLLGVYVAYVVALFTVTGH